MVTAFGGLVNSRAFPNYTQMEGWYVAEDLQLLNLGDPKSAWIPQYISVRLFRLSHRLRQKVINAGEIADYVSWLKETFGGVRSLATREKLWELMAQRVSQRQIRGLEFGVAFGYASGWWLRRLPVVGLQWDGFDRFTGLPRAWRGFDAGAFDAGGRTPPIDDQRVTWHVGDVEDQLKDLMLSREEPQQIVVLFDLDIFEPSFAAWEHLRDSLRPGDLLYFDEAVHSDERRLLNDHVLPAGKYECIGATPTALGLQVTQITPR
jgi:hypothetical protein